MCIRDIPCGRQTLKKRVWKEYRLHDAKLYLCKLRQLPWQAGREVKPRYKIPDILCARQTNCVADGPPVMNNIGPTARWKLYLDSWYISAKRQTVWQPGGQYRLHAQSPHMYIARLDLTNCQVETVSRQYSCYISAKRQTVWQTSRQYRLHVQSAHMYVARLDLANCHCI